MAQAKKKPMVPWIGVLAGLAAVGVIIASSMNGGGESGSESTSSNGNRGGARVQGGVAFNVSVFAAGSPVEGAMVIGEVGEGVSYRSVDSLTDDAGHVTLHGLPAGAGRVVVEASGLLRTTVEAEIAEGALIEVSLEPAQSFAGIVLDEEGEPIGNAEVRLRVDGDGMPWAAETDGEGRFAFDTLPEGVYHFEVRAEGFETVEMISELDTEVIFLEHTCTIRGQVVYSDGTPAAEVNVLMAGTGLWPPAEINTDDDGRFVSSGLPPGLYEVRAFADDLVAPPARGIDLEPGETRDVELTLDHGMVVVGRVVDASNDEPVAGARVVATEGALAFVPRVEHSRHNGAFEIFGLMPRAHRISVTAPGYVSIRGLEVSPEDDVVYVELRKSALLAGVVVDERGDPVAHARIEVVGRGEEGRPVSFARSDVEMFAERSPLATEALADYRLSLDPTADVMRSPVTERGSQRYFAPPQLGQLSGLTIGSNSGSERRRYFTTDAQGRFRIPGVPPGELSLVVRHPEFATTRTAPELVVSGARRDGLRITLSRGGRITGHLVDARGDGVPNAVVELRVESGRSRHTRTGERGEFDFSAVVGPVFLTAMLDGAPAARQRLEVPSGEEVETTISLDVNRSPFYGRALDSRGFPIAGAEVRVRSLRSGVLYDRRVVSRGDGTFQIASVPEVPLRLVGDHPEYAIARFDTSDPNHRDEVTLTFASAGSIKVSFLDDWQNTPVVGASLTLTQGRRSFSADTDSEGRATFTRLPSGSYVLAWEHNSFMPGQQGVQLREGSWGVDDIELDPIRIEQAASVSGVVIDALSEPVPGARVWVGEQTTRSDAQGRYTLRSLPAEECVVRGSHPAAGEGASYEVRLYGGQESPDIWVYLPEQFDPERANVADRSREGVAAIVRDSDEGASVIFIAPGSAAAASGLAIGDIIVEVDGVACQDAQGARWQLKGPSDISAVVVVERLGERETLFIDRELWEAPG